MEYHVALDRAQSRKAPAQGQKVRKHRWGLTQVGSQAKRVELRNLGDSQLMAEVAEGEKGRKGRLKGSSCTADRQETSLAHPQPQVGDAGRQQHGE